MIKHFKQHCIILIFLLSNFDAHCQLKLKDIQYDLSNINKIDYNGRQGVWFFYEKRDSTILETMVFFNDTPMGHFERYWGNGKISEMGFYKKGVLDSSFFAYWEDGSLRGKALYKNGLLNGIATSYNRAGEITSRYKYQDGIIDSESDSTYIDPEIIWDYPAGDKLDTVITTLDSKWNKRWAIYKNDTLFLEIQFYKNKRIIENIHSALGSVKRIIYSIHSPYHIKRIYYFENGSLVKTEYYDKRGELKMDNKK